MRWTSTAKKENLPVPHDPKTVKKTGKPGYYYLVWTKTYGKMFAMYMKGRTGLGWYSSYAEKISDKVTHYAFVPPPTSK